MGFSVSKNILGSNPSAPMAVLSISVIWLYAQRGCVGAVGITIGEREACWRSKGQKSLIGHSIRTLVRVDSNLSIPADVDVRHR